MKNLSPAAYDVAITPSCILMVKCCARTDKHSGRPVGCHAGCILCPPAKAQLTADRYYKMARWLWVIRHVLCTSTLGQSLRHQELQMLAERGTPHH